MDEFILKEVKENILGELAQIGFDKTYANKAVEKFKFKNIKIFELSIAQANILKQCAISVGADCAVHRETITGKIETTDCLLGGSFSQLRKIAQKLRKQPFKLSKLADLIEKKLDFKLKPIIIKGKTFDFTRPYIVGILNLTQNSFSDGGEFFEYDSAVKHLLEMINDGADIIDIGAESTKPFSQGVSAQEQINQILPILKYIEENNINIPISIDTRSSEVAAICLKAGADIINDVSGFDFDQNMAKTITEAKAFVIIQHSKGTPENMQISPEYNNVTEEIFFELNKKIDFAISQGINPEKIIADPGIGFGKTKEQNFEILERLDEINSLGYPIMLGISRKSFLNLPTKTNEQKDILTFALNSKLADKINFIRVHNVKLHSAYFNPSVGK